ncbi:hypothetical protein [Janthinobacterium sp. 17J80-10]|uniref:hypothetical protein n=1 Tax=Janthinobacterium sp. 17J80-10 TaxID=2497863 RepID=UPI0010057876|nr:hypothetical protein [Janthinobacterium sp. 17J80-10]QAU33121.1 hypothetical protein EKL02_02415 [Janthinobacterium sp. 17J80-10]
MSKQNIRKASAAYRPGTWSTDEYIRKWAADACSGRAECVIPLQSLQDSWVARVRLDAPGKPVERLLAEQV